MKKVILIIILCAIYVHNSFADDNKVSTCKSISQVKLDADEIDSLLLFQLKRLYEDEKLALMVYSSFKNEYDLPIFDNISQSEESHRKSVENLLINIKEASTVLNREDTVFTISDNQTTYNRLIDEGSVSLINALKTGALIEDLDIFHLNGIINNTNNENIINVCLQLKSASENHMRAFNKQLNWRGISYTPQYISEEELHSILSGVNNCKGK